MFIGDVTSMERMDATEGEHDESFILSGKASSAKRNKIQKVNCYKTYLNNIHQWIRVLVDSANIKELEDQAVVDKIESDMQDLFAFIETREKLLEGYEQRFFNHEKLLDNLIERMDKVEGEKLMNEGSIQSNMPTCAEMLKRPLGNQVNQARKKIERPIEKKDHVVIIEPKGEVKKVARAALIEIVEKSKGVSNITTVIKVSADEKKGIVMLNIKEEAEALMISVNTATECSTARPLADKGIGVFALFGVFTSKSL